MLQFVHRFPVEKKSFSDLAGTIKFEVHETRCTTCEVRDAGHHDGSGGVDLTLVEIERKGCVGCGMNGWASDNWRETGVFNVNNNLLVHLHVYYEIRSGVQAGIPIKLSLNGILGSRRDYLDWIARNEVLAERISSDAFLTKLAYGYPAFEALCDHGYYFESIVDGNFPKVLTVDGCLKVATDDVNLTQFTVGRGEQDLDADLQHQLLKLSMMSLMVFGFRLRFISEAKPTFSPFNPFNHVFNVVRRSARGAMPKEGSPESGRIPCEGGRIPQ